MLLFLFAIFFPLAAATYNVKTTAWDISDNQSLPHAIANATSLSDQIHIDLPSGLGGTITIQGPNTIAAGRFENRHASIVTLAADINGILLTSSNMTLAGPFNIPCRMNVPNGGILTVTTGTNTLSSLEMWNATLNVQTPTIIDTYLSINRTSGSNCFFDVAASQTLSVTGGFVSLMAPIIKLGEGFFLLSGANTLVYHSDGVQVGSTSTVGGKFFFGSTIDYPPSFSLATPSGATLSHISFSNTSTLASYGTINIEGDGGLIDLGTNVNMRIQTLASVGTSAYLAKTGGGMLSVRDSYNLPNPAKIYGGTLEFYTMSAMNGKSVGLYGGTLSLAEQNTYTSALFVNSTSNIFIPGSNTVTWSGTVTSSSTQPAILNKSGAGTLNLTSTSNDFLSPISIDEGVLGVATQQNIQGSSTNPEIILNGGSVNYTQNVNLSNNFTIPAAKTGDMTGANADLSGTFSGSGNLRLISTNFTILPTLASTFSGSVLKTFGFLNINNNTFPSASQFYLYNGSVLQGYTDVSLPGNISLSGSVIFWVNDNGSGTKYEMTLSGNVTSGGTLCKQGTGKLYLTGTNSYSLGTNILAGIVEGNTNSIKGDITLAASSEVIFNQTSGGTFTGNITGAGDFVKTGGSTLTLLGTNTLTGNITIQEGLLAGQVQAFGGTGVINLTQTLGSIEITHSSTLAATIQRGMTGAGNFSKRGTGKLIITGSVQNQTINLYEGTLQTYPLDKTLSTITVANATTYIIDSSNAGTFNGTTYVDGALVITGGGNLDYRSTSANGSGTTSIESGSLRLYGDGNTLPSGSFTFNGASTQLGLFKSATTTLSNPFIFNQSNCGFYAENSVDFASSTTFTSTTGTSSSIVFSGPTLSAPYPTFNIAQSSPFTGGINILSCCLNLTDASFADSYYTSLNNGSLAILDSSGAGRQIGGLESTTTSYVFCGTTLGGNNGTLISKQNREGSFTGSINCDTFVKTGSQKLILAGASNISNKVRLSEGTLQIPSLANLGSVNQNFELNAGTLKITTYSNFPANLSVTNSPTIEHSGLTLSGTITGTGNLRILSSVYTNINPPSNNTISGQIILTGGGEFLLISKSFPSASGIEIGASSIISNGDNIHFTMPVTIGSGTTTLGVYGSSIFTFSNQVSGSSTIVKTGGGTVKFTTSSKSFSGDLLVSQGAVVIEGSSPLNAASSVTNNGTFQIAATATASTVKNFESTGTLIIDSNIYFDNSVAKTVSGVVSGSQGFIKTGGASMTLSASNSSFTGGLYVDGGTLVIQSSFSTGNCSSIGVRSGSILDLSNAASPTLQFATGGGTFSLGSNAITLTATGSGLYEISGPINGAGGSITVNGTAEYRFNGTNSYSGGTTVNGGILSGKPSGIQGNIVNNGLIRFLEGGTYSGNMSGNGTLSVSLGGTLTLSGTNTFLGGLEILGGTVACNSSSISGNITDGGTLIFNQSTNGAYSGTIAGNGSFIKNLNGNLNLTGNSPSYTGDISLNAGLLGINANYSSSSVTVNSGATIYGTGSIKNLTNNGTLNPGNSIGTITITGDYTQSSASTLNIEINPAGLCDLVVVSGTANLDGTLNIIQLPGFYPAGTSYLFLTAGNISSDFSTKNTGTIVNPVLNRTSTSYSLTVDQQGSGGGGQFVPPIPNSQITGNSFELASALFCENAVSTGDLQQIKLGLVNLSPQEYLIALSAIAPDELSGITLIEMENQSKLIDLLSNRVNRLSDYFCDAFLSMPKNTFYISPISFWLNQKGNNSAIGYKGNTTGFGLGYENQFVKNTFMGLGGAYTRSVTHFYSQQGKLSSNGFYLSPYLATKIENLYLATGIMGSYDATQFFRYIVYPGVNRAAYCEPSTWNVTGQVQCRYAIDLTPDKYLEPLFEATFSGVYRKNTTETGANSLDFNYPSDWNVTVRNILKCTAGAVHCFPQDFSLDMRGSLGYVLNALVTSNDYEALFLVPDQVCFPNLDFKGLEVNQSQLFSQLNLILKKKDRGKASLNLSYQWGKTMQVTAVDFSLEMSF